MGGGPGTEGRREAGAAGNRRGRTVLLVRPPQVRMEGEGEEQAPEGLRLPRCLCCLLSPDTCPPPPLPSLLVPRAPPLPRL